MVEGKEEEMKEGMYGKMKERRENGRKNGGKEK